MVDPSQQQQQQQQQQHASPHGQDRKRPRTPQDGDDMPTTSGGQQEPQQQQQQPASKRAAVLPADVSAAGRAIAGKVRALRDARPRTRAVDAGPSRSKPPTQHNQQQQQQPQAKPKRGPAIQTAMTANDFLAQARGATPTATTTSSGGGGGGGAGDGAGLQQQQQQQQQQASGGPAPPAVGVTRIGGVRRTSASLLARISAIATGQAAAGKGSGPGSDSPSAGSGGGGTPKFSPGSGDLSGDADDEDSSSNAGAEDGAAAAAAAAADAAVDAVLADLAGTGAGIRACAARLLQFCAPDGDGGGAGGATAAARRIVSHILARMEGLPPGPRRIDLLYATDCLLAQAARPDAPAAARELPNMVGAGLVRLLQLAATDAASLARAERALAAWERRGALDARYLGLARARLTALAAAHASGGAGPAAPRDAGGGDDGGIAYASAAAAETTTGRQPMAGAEGLVRVVLAALPAHIDEDALLPGLAARVAALAEQRDRERAAAAQAVAQAEAELANLLGADDDDGGGSGGGGGGGEDGQGGAAPGGRAAADADSAAAASAGNGVALPSSGDQQQQQPGVRRTFGPRRLANAFGPAATDAFLLDPWAGMAAAAAAGGSADTAVKPASKPLRRLLAQGALRLALRADPALALLPDAGQEAAAADARVSTWREALQSCAGAPNGAQPAVVGTAFAADTAADDGWRYDDADGGDAMGWMAHVPAAPQRDDAGEALALAAWNSTVSAWQQPLPKPLPQQQQQQQQQHYSLASAPAAAGAARRAPLRVPDAILPTAAAPPQQQAQPLIAPLPPPPPIAPPPLQPPGMQPHVMQPPPLLPPLLPQLPPQQWDPAQQQQQQQQWDPAQQQQQQQQQWDPTQQEQQQWDPTQQEQQQWDPTQQEQQQQPPQQLDYVTLQALAAFAPPPPGQQGWDGLEQEQGAFAAAAGGAYMPPVVGAALAGAMVPAAGAWDHTGAGGLAAEGAWAGGGAYDYGGGGGGGGGGEEGSPDAGLVLPRLPPVAPSGALPGIPAPRPKAAGGGPLPGVPPPRRNAH